MVEAICMCCHNSLGQLTVDFTGKALQELTQFPLGSTQVLLPFADFASFVSPKEILAIACQPLLGEALVPLTHMPP